MFKKALAVFLALTLMASLFAGCANNAPQPGDTGTKEPADSGQKIVMKIAHAAKPGSARDQGAVRIKEVVEKETNGKVEVQLYPASQLGGGKDLIEGMQMSTIEMVILPSSFLGGFAPLTTIMDLPFFFPEDYKKMMELEAGPAGQKLRATTEEIGVKTLDIWHTGYKGFSAQTTLRKPADFKGLKFRVMPSPIQIAQYEAMSATPINMEFSECYNALQSGAIDGQENPIDTTYDMKFHEVQKTFTLSRHGVLDQFIMVSKDWFEKLPADIQAAVLKGVEEGRQVAIEKTHETEEIGLAAFKEKGLEIVELTADERAAFMEATKGVKDTYVSKYGEKAAELLKVFEEEIAKLK